MVKNISTKAFLFIALYIAFHLPQNVSAQTVDLAVKVVTSPAGADKWVYVVDSPTGADEWVCITNANELDKETQKKLKLR
jgi:hypothetical protein